MAPTPRDQRTERPTARRRREFRRDGRVARSADLGAVASLVVLLVLLRATAPGIVDRFRVETSQLLAEANGAFEAGMVGRAVPGLLMGALVPTMGSLLCVAVAVSLLQTGTAFAPRRLRPRWSRISPRQGLQRFRPATLGWEVVRVVVKIAVLVVVLWGPVRDFADTSGRLYGLDEWFGRAGSTAVALLVRATLALLVIGALDYTVSRRRLMSEMKMTRQEVRDELKATEGDQLLRRVRRQRAQSMSRNRMIGAVGSADVVIVNPIRFAVALSYEEGTAAPVVVAKGAGEVARRIRSEAYRHGITVHAEPPLARALYRRCVVGQSIPVELFEAVAVVLAAVYRRRRERVAA